MGFYYSTKSLSPAGKQQNKNKYESNPSNNFLKDIPQDFLNWFSGFSDGEANFLISIDRGYVRFRFKIYLHIDDIEVLNTIKSKLNIGRVTIESTFF